MSGPVPSRLVFLSDLPSIKSGEKVRFLGCVEKYETATATLILRHDFPPDSPNPTVAFINIEHLLESVKRSDIEKGAWVNLVGYKIMPVHSEAEKRKGPMLDEDHACVQAVMLWSAGPLKLNAYETALASRFQGGK